MLQPQTTRPEHLLENWPTDIAAARAIQADGAAQVIRNDDLGTVRRVAGVDVGFENNGQITRAAVAILGFPDLALREQAISRSATRFPYIPGYLSFREVPAILSALQQLATPPDLLLCDGQGLAHPRRFGLACHLGVASDLPSIGVAKSRLVGDHAPLPAGKGNWVALIHRGETVGAVLRTRTGVSPVYVSIGHRISLPTAIEYVLRCTTRFRLPETTRCAHRLASGYPRQ